MVTAAIVAGNCVRTLFALAGAVAMSWCVFSFFMPGIARRPRMRVLRLVCLGLTIGLMGIGAQVGEAIEHTFQVR